jgi:hypothetical protein
MAALLRDLYTAQLQSQTKVSPQLREEIADGKHDDLVTKHVLGEPLARSHAEVMAYLNRQNDPPRSEPTVLVGGKPLNPEDWK